ncbi:MAG: MarR family transcriptional regulator [Actinobacteria bacterium]|nr:MarR family transcriptional regulator [Actinomycetota bacterium]
MDPDHADHVDRLVSQWADQRPELATAALSISARVIRLERFLGRVANAATSSWGLTEGELNVLAALRRSGPPFALTPTQLYQGLLLSSGAMTNRIDRLEQQDLVERQRDVEDRRRILVRLTDAGRELIDEAMDAHVAGLEDVFADLGADEREQLTQLLRKLLARLEAEA